MVGRVISLALVLALLGISVAMLRHPAWFVDRSPATRYDPSVARETFVRQVRRMGRWGSVAAGALVLLALLFLVAYALG